MFFKLNLIKLCISFIFCIFWIYATQYFISLKYKNDFNDEKQKVLNTLNSTLSLYKTSIFNLQSIYQINNNAFDFNDFQIYNAQISSYLDVIVGAGFYPYISKREQLHEFELNMKEKTNTQEPLYQNFKLSPFEIDPNHNLFLQYVYPFKDYTKSVGKNLLKFTDRADAVHYAITHNFAVSRKIKRKLPTKSHEAIIFFMPIFKDVKNLNQVRPENRNFAHLFGFVSMGFSLDELLKTILKQNINQEIGFKVLDVTKNKEFYDNNDIILNHQLNSSSYTFQTMENITIGGRTWQLIVQASPNFIELEWKLFPYLMGIFGFIITWVIASQIQLRMLVEKQNELLNETKMILEKSELELKKIVDSIPMVFAITDIKDSKFLLYNQRMIDVFKLTKPAEYARDFYASPEQSDIFVNEVKNHDGVIKDFELQFKKETGELFYGLISVTFSYYKGKEVYLVAIHDITHRKKNEETLRILATTDGLTNLYNRRYFMELAHKNLEQSISNKRYFALLMLDIDHFKNINDNYGHDIGDKVIQLLALTCVTFLPENSIIGRLGGEEFGIVLPNTDLDSAINIANALRDSIEYQPLNIPQLQFDLAYTVSIGVSALTRNRLINTESQQTIEDLLKLADKALYRSKQNGRNQVQALTE